MMGNKKPSRERERGRLRLGRGLRARERLRLGPETAEPLRESCG
jgi:hypothetical protein